MTLPLKIKISHASNLHFLNGKGRHEYISQRPSVVFGNDRMYSGYPITKTISILFHYAKANGTASFCSSLFMELFFLQRK